MAESEMAVKIAAESVSSAASVLPTTVEDEIRVFYYPSDEEFNIWMVAMIGMGSLFLVFVGVTIFLICSSKNDPGRNKTSTSAMTTQRPTEFRTTRGRQPSQQIPEA